MRGEIGSEFWDVPVSDKANGIFPDYTQWYLSGRSALKAIIRNLKGERTISLPSWCCDSMIKPFLDANFKINFYPVVIKEGLFQEVDFGSDVLLVLDYFGYKSNSPDLSAYRGVVIRDLTHSVFSSSYTDADYYFGSLRKWCGVWTGGYAWTRDCHKLPNENAKGAKYISLRKQAMDLKRRYIEGQSVDKGYLKIFYAAEECLEATTITSAANRDVQLANRLDVQELRSRRRRNAKVLMNAFSEWLIFPNLADSDTPMFVPIIVPGGKRNDLRSYLIKREIYCPIHWPVSSSHVLNDRTKYIYDNELSLVCDQRYTESDMFRIVEAINDFWKEL